MAVRPAPYEFDPGSAAAGPPAGGTIDPTAYGMTPTDPSKLKPAPYEWDDAAPKDAAPKGDGKRHPIQAGLESAKRSLTLGLPYEVKKLTGNLTPEDEQDTLAKMKASKAKEGELLPGGPSSS